MKFPCYVVIICLLISCGGGGETDVDVVASVGERQIQRSCLEMYLKNILGEEQYGSSPEILSQLLDQFLEEELLYGEAVRNGLSPEKPRSVVITDFIHRECDSLPEPAEAEVQEYFQRNKNKFHIGQTSVFRMILVETRSEAEEILEKIGMGKPFPDLANEYSRAPNAGEGGAVGPIEMKCLPRNISSVLEHLSEGEISEIVEVPYGFLLFQLVNTLEPGDLSLQEVYDDIVLQLKEEACERHREELVEKIEDKEHIWIYAHHLPFPYRGKYSCWQ